MKSLRLHWDIRHGWLIDVPFGLSEAAIQRIAQWALPHQIQRLRSLPPGTHRREQLRWALRQLEAGKIRQRLTPSEQAMPFASNQRMTNRRYFYG